MNQQCFPHAGLGLAPLLLLLCMPSDIRGSVRRATQHPPQKKGRLIHLASVSLVLVLFIVWAEKFIWLFVTWANLKELFDQPNTFPDFHGKASSLGCFAPSRHVY